ncbi:MAG: Pr6Pr family membrane protein [Clostridia bacterium]|nr:Pr6Pr family membrane protein [Clostridia bacterium]
MTTTKRMRFLTIYNAAIVLLVLVAWGRMLSSGDETTLSTGGLANLKYFTVLSNLLEGAAAAILAIEAVLVLCGKREAIAPFVLRLKYAATVAVAITFLVVLIFLGPLYGFDIMYVRANFWFHLVIPLLAMAEFCLFDRFSRLSFRQAWMAVLPPLIYGLAYAANILINGVEGNDIYGFVMWGLPTGFAIFAGILALSYGVGCLLLLGHRAGRKEGT